MFMKDKRILVPVDGSDPANRALALAVQIGRDTGASLDIVSVVDLRHVDAYDGYMLSDQQYQEMTVSVRQEVLEVAVAGLPADAPEHRSRLLWGGVPETLLKEAEAGDVAMVILGRTGKGFFGRLLEGSVSRALATLCPVPVVVVP